MIKRDDTGEHISTDDIQLSVLDGGRIFQRKALRMHLKTGETENICWIVGELDGVRVYIKEGHLIMTKQDLNP